VAEDQKTPETEGSEAIVEAGKVSKWLTENGFQHESLEPDHLGVEIIKVDRDYLIPLATALYAYGFNYLHFFFLNAPPETGFLLFFPGNCG
jgi:NAD(P)H-quinone oxidoreductase subunit J